MSQTSSCLNGNKDRSGGGNSASTRLWLVLRAQLRWGNPTVPLPATKFAREHLRAGHQEEALKWLTLACEERNVFRLMIASDLLYDPLRADRRFAKLLRRIKAGW